MNNLLLKVTNISKKYPGVKALAPIDFDLPKGEVHAIVGENGAGKSTFIEILAGSIIPDTGNIQIGGYTYKSLDPVKSIEVGIQTVHQENKLIGDLSIAENIYLYNLQKNRFGLFSLGKCFQACRDLLGSLNIELAPQTKIKDLSPVEKKLVSLAKAISRNSQILILDEPTVSLDTHGKKILFQIIENCIQQGMSVIYISHNLDEVFEIAKNVTILKDGEKVNTHSVKEIQEDFLVSEMIGRSFSSLFQKRIRDLPPGEKENLLEVRNYSRSKVVKDISFTIKKGEIFGIGGLVGSGRTELVRLLFGLDQKDSGQLVYCGQEITPDTPHQAIRSGIGFLTEDRKISGLITTRPIFENISLVQLAKKTRLFLNLNTEKEKTSELSQKLNVETPSISQLVNNLSGGNQQKVVLAKWMFSNSNILIFDEPTVGVDIGAKSHIYQLMHKIADEGKIIIMVSSDMLELISISDRVGVMRNGRLEDILEKSDINEENILRCSLGTYRENKTSN
jgi:ribose transport system ATP-binding protein